MACREDKIKAERRTQHAGKFLVVEWSMRGYVRNKNIVCGMQNVEKTVTGYRHICDRLPPSHSSLLEMVSYFLWFKM